MGVKPVRFMKTFHTAGAVAQMVEQQKLLFASGKESSYESPVCGSQVRVLSAPQ